MKLGMWHIVACDNIAAPTGDMPFTAMLYSEISE